MDKRQQLQRIIIRELSEGLNVEFAVPLRILEDMLDDPNDKPIGKWDISKNEALLLAGGRPDRSPEELLNEWCQENGIEWHDDPARWMRTFRKTAKEQMCEALSFIAARALRWQDVEAVQIGTEKNHSNGELEGRIWLRLANNRDYSHIISYAQITHSRSLEEMVRMLRLRAEGAVV